MEDYLDAILKNFGVITCGWSATWDKALVNHISSNVNHRYSYYYTYLGDLSDEINELASKSKGETLQIDNADNFFTEMNERLKALEIINGKNMETDVEVAIARVKMYIADLKKLIQYTDLYENVTNQLLRDVQRITYGKQYPDAALFDKAIAENAQALATLLPMGNVAIRWAVNEHYQAIAESLSMVANREIDSPNKYYEASLKLNHLLDTIYLYGLGMACVFYKKFGLLDLLFRVKIYKHDDYFSPYIIDQDNCWIIDRQIWNNSTGYPYLKTPFSTNVANMLKPYFPMIHDDKEFFSLVCIFEKLLAMYYFMLITKDSKLAFGVPMGMFCWRPVYLERNGESSYKQFFETIDNEKDNSQLLKDGMFDGKYQTYKEAYDAVTGMEQKALANMY